MKKKVSVILSVILTFSMVSAMASPSVDLDFSYNKEARVLNIDGGFGTSEHAACMVYIYDASLTSSRLSDSNTPIFAELAITGANGSFEFTRTLAENYPSGRYRVSISSAHANWSTEFMYTNASSVTSLLSQINGAATASALENILIINAYDLGIDTSVYIPVKDDVASFLFSNKPQSGYSTDEFINALDQCTASALLKSGSDASGILKSNASVISIDYENDYNKFTSDIKSAINTELKNANYTTGLLSELYPKLRAVAFMKAAPTWQALKNALYGVDSAGNIIASNYSVINPDLTVFNNVSNKDNVFALMFKQRSSLTSVENIRTIFKNCAQEAYNNEQVGSSPGIMQPSPSSPSGPGSGAVSISPGYTNQYTEPVKPSLFNDTPSTEWYYEPVEKLTSLSLINGYEDNSFRPDNSITRAEYTKLIVGIAEYMKISLGDTDTDVGFTDVLSSDWYAEVVKKAATSGIVMGYDGKFNPNDHISRQDAAVILYRLASKIKSIDGSKTFADDSIIADYAKTAVSALSYANIISGMGDNTFAPNENLTRAQAAKLLYAALEYLS